MKNGGKIVLGCGMAALNLALCAQTNAIVTDSSGNPYHGIVERNVFALKPLPPPVDPKDLIKKPDAPKITLTGITTILHKKQVLMNVQMPAKPPEPAKQQSFIITEGQRDGDIEVLEIDEKVGSVRLNNFGTPMTLTMEKDGAKLPASAPGPQVAGGTPNMPNVPNPAGYTPHPATDAGIKPIPTRQLRLPGGENQAAVPNGTANPNNAYGTSVPNNAYGTPIPNTGYGTPTVGLNVAPTPGVSPVPPPAPGGLKPEEGAILMEAEYQVAAARGDPIARIYPPTDLDPTRNLTGAGQEAHTPAPNTQGPQPPRIVPPLGRPLPQ